MFALTSAFSEVWPMTEKRERIRKLKAQGMQCRTAQNAERHAGGMVERLMSDVTESQMTAGQFTS
jgi:hypothetical protein